jgi:hypothetical protein
MAIIAIDAMIAATTSPRWEVFAVMIDFRSARGGIFKGELGALASTRLK